MLRIDDWPQQRRSPALWTESSHVTDGAMRLGALGIVADARRTGTRINVDDVTDHLHEVREDLPSGRAGRNGGKVRRTRRHHGCDVGTTTGRSGAGGGTHGGVRCARLSQ